MRHYTILIVAMITSLSLSTPAEATKYWPDSEERVKRSTHNISSYNPALHKTFSNHADYEEGGRYYYRGPAGHVNSFGQQERLNTDQEILFCGPGDRTFSETLTSLYNQKNLFAELRTWYGDSAPATSSPFSVKDDSTSVGFTPAMFEDAVENTLLNNSNDRVKGRFCYRENDTMVDYRTPGAEKAVYCDPATGSHGQPHIFIDTSSLKTCEIVLDVPIKVGETRFVRQLQETSDFTIAQGFVGCYANESSGLPEVKLIENPPTCNKINREDCARTCEWAHQVVCDAKLMPKWGGGQCGAFGTMIFKDDVIDVGSVDSLSYNRETKKLYRGEAIMSCAMVSGKAQWVVNDATCNIVTE